MSLDLVLAAIFGALATAVIGPLLIAALEVNRHDLQVSLKDDDLEEWIVIRDRQLKQRWQEVEEKANEAGVLDGGTMAAARAAVQTIVLYEYREELRQAHSFVLSIEGEERWTHRLVRLLKRQPFPSLATPERAARLIDLWEEGTDRNALTWSLDDILSGLPQRATSRAKAI